MLYKEFYIICSNVKSRLKDNISKIYALNFVTKDYLSYESLLKKKTFYVIIMAFKKFTIELFYLKIKFSFKNFMQWTSKLRFISLNNIVNNRDRDAITHELDVTPNSLFLNK